VRYWYGEALGLRPFQAASTVETPWLGTKLGYLRLDVQGRYSPPVDTPTSDQTVVHYLLTGALRVAPGADRDQPGAARALRSNHV
jgi:hypothetical protein